MNELDHHLDDDIFLNVQRGGSDKTRSFVSVGLKKGNSQKEPMCWVCVIETEKENVTFTILHLLLIFLGQPIRFQHQLPLTIIIIITMMIIT